MTEDMMANKKLMKEYDEVFDSEEKVQQSLKISKNNFSLYVGVVNFNECAFTDPIKDSRKETYLGLTKSISELGILSPIHVMVTEGYSLWREEGNSEEEFEGYKYMVIDGFRRIYGGMKNGLKRCNAVIWDFEDKERGSELLTTLSLVLNKAQKHSWSELWLLMQILQIQSPLTAGTLEYLLQLESGDSDKLKAIMERASDFPEPKQDLLDNKKTLQQAYTMLQKLMKEQDQLYVEDNKGISEVENAEDIIDKEDRDGLSDDEVREVLEMEDSFDGELSDNDFDELMGNNIESERFEVDGDRHLDPKLRQAVLQRDNYMCQATGFGEGLPAEVALAVLQIHHKVPVADGGTNDIDNLITLSQDPHTLVHVIQRRGGKLGMKKEDYDVLPEHTQSYLKKVMKIARVAVEADRRCGKTREQVKKDTAESLRYQMPGAILNENMKAYKLKGRDDQ